MLTSDERTLFRKLARRLWVIGIGLALVGAWYGFRTYTEFAALTRAAELNTTSGGTEVRKGPHVPSGLATPFLLLTAVPTLFAAWKASRATHLQISARQAMFAVLIDLNAALTWLSLVMLVVVLSVIVFFAMLAVSSLMV